ncbi:MAG: hypothetical protein LUI87_02610, partial [Lachnospiraceae bacterium]|nr:hypothetical protein [Lachnospiraceae bacterium]
RYLITAGINDKGHYPFLWGDGMGEPQKALIKEESFLAGGFDAALLPVHKSTYVPGRNHKRTGEFICCYCTGKGL